MRHFTLIAFAALLALPLQAQVIFQSGFETWANNLPTDWFGARSNIAMSGVGQVSQNILEGQYAVRLTKTGTGHQRFSTQTMDVVDGETYEVNFHVRGQGQIRLGLYDGRPTGSGYAAYTAFTTVTGNVWTEVTLTISATMTTSDAEFILSVQSTEAPEHLVVDDVSISLVTIEPPIVTSVHEIQESQAPDGSSPLIDQTVFTGGIVTGNASNGFFIQNGGGPWSGIFVFSTLNVPARGDSVTFTASVTEFFGMTQLENVNDFVIVSQGNPEVITTTTAAGAKTEDYESVLVRVLAATCTNTDIGNNQWAVNDGTATLSVDKLLFSYSPVQGAAYNITGPTRYSFDSYRVMPRDINDIAVVTGTAEQALSNVALFPNPAVDLLTITGIEGRTEYLVCDAVGRVVRSGMLQDGRNTISLENVPNGTYMLTLRHAKATSTMRMVVQH